MHKLYYIILLNKLYYDTEKNSIVLCVHEIIRIPIALNIILFL